MKFIVAFVALVHVVLSQDTSTTPMPAFHDTNVNGVNAGNMNGVANPGNMNPGNLNPGGAPNAHGNGFAVNNYPMAAGGNLGGDTSTTVIPGAGINGAGINGAGVNAAGVNAAGQGATTAIGIGGSVGDSDSDSSEETGSELDIPDAAASSVGGAAQEAGDTPDSPDTPDGAAGIGVGGGGGGGGGGRDRDDQAINEIGDTPDGAENMVDLVDVDMGEQVGTSSAGVTVGILVAVVAIVAAAVGVGLYVIKQRRNDFSSSNV